MHSARLCVFTLIKNSNLNEWLKQASNVLRPNEQLYLEFMSLTGLRKEEGIISFNKIIELTKQGNLNEYYNEEKGLLEHFKYKEQFLRRTKNVYISIISKRFSARTFPILNHVSYDGMRKRLMRAKLAV